MPEQTTTDPIVREIEIDARPETVFAFFTEGDRLSRWLATDATTDPRAGGAMHLVQHSPNGQAYRMRGEFVELDPPRRVVFTWRYQESDIRVGPGESTVEVTLTPRDGGTHVRLLHRDLPDHELEGHSGGWTMMLDRLAAAVA